MSLDLLSGNLSDLTGDQYNTGATSATDGSNGDWQNSSIWSAISSLGADATTAFQTNAAQNAQTTKAQQNAQATVAVSKSNTTLYVIGGVILAAIVLAFFIFKRK